MCAVYITTLNMRIAFGALHLTATLSSLLLQFATHLIVAIAGAIILPNEAAFMVLIPLLVPILVWVSDMLVIIVSSVHLYLVGLEKRNSININSVINT